MFTLAAHANDVIGITLSDGTRKTYEAVMSHTVIRQHDNYSWYNQAVDGFPGWTFSAEMIPSEAADGYIFLADWVTDATDNHSDYVNDVKNLTDRIKQDFSSSNIEFKVNEFKVTSPSGGITNQCWSYGIMFKLDDTITGVDVN